MITLEKARTISLEKIQTLQPEFGKRVQSWWEECWEHMLYAYVYCGFRSREEQDALYEIGRSKPGRVVTNARAGQSFHNHGLAVDWVPLVPHEKGSGLFVPGWDEKELYAAGQAKAFSRQMRWLDWERPHLEDATIRPNQHLWNPPPPRKRR